MSRSESKPPDDYAVAHRRHWQDAETLFGLDRLGNADHLYAFSAECGLKAVMTEWKLMGRKYHKHVQELWPEFVQLAEGRSGLRFLRLLPDGAPFADWSHHHRYGASGYGTEESVRSHREAAREVWAMVQAAEESL